LDPEEKLIPGLDTNTTALSASGSEVPCKRNAYAIRESCLMSCNKLNSRPETNLRREEGRATCVTRDMKMLKNEEDPELSRNRIKKTVSGCGILIAESNRRSCQKYESGSMRND
jgi:hypothetical protein